MGEDEVSADEARQVPWLKRTKAQRKAIVAEANARSSAKEKERLARIDQWHEQRMDKINARAEQSTPRRRRARGGSSFGDPNAIIWDYLPHPVLLIPGAIVFVVVFIVVLVVVL